MKQGFGELCKNIPKQNAIERIRSEIGILVELFLEVQPPKLETTNPGLKQIYTEPELTKEELEYVVNLLTMRYLEMWLFNDEKLRKTIYSFEGSSYDIDDSSGDLTNDAHRKSLQRAGKDLKININLQNEQEKKVGNSFKRLLYNKKGKKYDFISLCFMDAISKKYLEIYKFLFYRKEILKLTYEKGNRDALDIGYEGYLDFIKEIKQLYETNKIGFVVSCLFLQKIESTYLFLFIAKLAKYMVDHNVDPKDKLAQPLTSWLLLWEKEKDNDRYLYITMKILGIDKQIAEGIYLQSFLLPQQKETDANAYDYEPARLLGFYDKIIEQAYCSENQGAINGKIYAMRRLSSLVFSFYLKLKPTKENGNLDETTFNQAADFIHNKVKFIDNLEVEHFSLKCEGSEKEKQYYDAIRILYQNKTFINAENIDLLREKIRKENKNKNKKKKK